MKTSVAILLFVITVGHVQGEQGVSELLTYRSEELNFEFKAPVAWKAEPSGKSGVLLSPGLEKWEGELPPPNHPWFIIFKPDEGICTLDDRGGPIFGFAGGKAEANTCRAGMAAVLGYYEKDRDQVKHVREMLEILESFRKLK